MRSSTLRTPRTILFWFLVALAPACSEPAVQGSAGTASPSPPAAPKPAEPGDECEADSDCTTTSLPPTPVRSAADCCFPTCEKRVVSRAEVDRLQPPFGANCAAVLCAPQSCPNAPDPVPVCRQGRCVAGS